MEVAHPEFNGNYMGLNCIISDYLMQNITRQRLRLLPETLNAVKKLRVNNAIAYGEIYQVSARTIIDKAKLGMQSMTRRMKSSSSLWDDGKPNKL